MSENTLSRLWFMRVMFVGLSAFLIFAQILPLNTSPIKLVAPDLVLALGFAWGMRRPDYVPAMLFGLTLLFADLMLGRPPGLFAAFALLALEALKARAPLMRNMPFTVEWFAASVAITAVILLHRIILALFLVEALSLKIALIQIIFTILCYPVVVGFSWLFFHLRKPSLGDVNALGERL